MPIGRLKKLENTTIEFSQKIKDLAKELKNAQNLSPDKHSEIPNENILFQEITNQYKTLSKESKELFFATRREDKSALKVTKSKYKFSEKLHSLQSAEQSR